MIFYVFVNCGLCLYERVKKVVRIKKKNWNVMFIIIDVYYGKIYVKILKLFEC